MRSQAKSTDRSERSADGFERYSASLIVRGFGTMRVRANGSRTEVGRIGRAVIALQPQTTPLFREVRSSLIWRRVTGSRGQWCASQRPPGGPCT